MPTKSFHNIASREGGRYAVAIVDVEPELKTNGIARLFEVVHRRQVCEFPVRYECAGGPRHTLSRDETVCLAGCYDAYGIAGYSIPEGREIWRRKDLKSVQTVEPFYDNDFVFCGREKGAAHLLNSQTGETVEQFAGIKVLYASPTDSSVVLGGKRLELQRPFGRKIASLKGDGFIRQAVFSKSSVLLDGFEEVRCVDLMSGDLMWALKPYDKVRHGAFCWSNARSCFIAKTIRSTGESFVALNPSTGQPHDEIPFEGRGTGAFCQQGDYWLNGDLRLISTSDGTLAHDFTTDAILRRDPRYKRELLLSLARDAKSPADLEEYMVTEGFGLVDIKNALLLQMAEDLRKRRSR